MHEHHRESASWQLAAELVRDQPTWQVRQTFVGGGFYDCLTLFAQDGARVVDINRHGSVHLFDGDRELPQAPMLAADTVWDVLTEPGGVPRVVTHIHDVLRLPRRRPRPQSTPEGLVYRVVAALITMTANDPRPATAVSAEGVDGPLTSALALCPDTAVFPTDRVWIVMAGGEPVLHLAGGWAWTAAGERLNLPDRRSRGQSIATLAATLLDGCAPTRRGRVEPGRAHGTVPVPPSTDLGALNEFAHTYNAYELLAPSPEELYALVHPVLDQARTRHQVDPTVGVDLARAALFYLARAAHHQGWLDHHDTPVWAALVDHIRTRSGGRVPVLPRPAR